MNKNVGFLHPGQMGISLAATARNSGYKAFWASEGRSGETRERASKYGLTDANNIKGLCQECSIIVSICPPHAAEEVAKKVRDCGFRGMYLDANAISPQRSVKIGELMEKANIDFIDGGIIGMPAWKPGTTWLYLSGTAAQNVAKYFSAGPMEIEVIGTNPGKASALKMCFAANTKGTTALLCGILGLSEKLGVRAELEKQWSRNGSEFADQTKNRVRHVTDRAWRFIGEMEEIASTFEGAGFPGGFHKAASKIYQRIAHFKGAKEVPSLEEVIEALLKQS